MSVRRKILLTSLSGTTDYNLNIPVSTMFGIAGQETVIDRDFIDIEVANSINQILDYEKVRFLPKINNSIVKNVTYTLKLIDSSNTYVDSYWSKLGFTTEDFYERRNAFTKSFLRLDFYDNDNTATQKLVFFVTIFPKFIIKDFKPNGNPPTPSEYQLKFTLGNGLLENNVNTQGFQLYYFKDEVLPTVPKELFMRALFANAKTGEEIRFMSSSDSNNSIDSLIKNTNNTNGLEKNKLHTKYILERTEEGYYYKISTSYSDNNVIEETNGYQINLFQINTK
jgi:hypothetical protein